MKITSLIIFPSLITLSIAYKILIISPTPFKSHSIIADAIARELSRKSHDVTLVSKFKSSENNVRSVILTNMNNGEIFIKLFTILIINLFSDTENMFNLASYPAFSEFFVMPFIIYEFVEFALNHEKMSMLLEENFDAVIVEIFETDALFGK